MAESEKAHATLEVSFGAEDAADGEGTDDSPTISMELDEVANEGKSQFLFGETANVRIFVKPSGLSISSMKANVGSATSGGKGTLRVEGEKVTFANSDTASPSKPITGSFSYKWIGAGGGALSASADGESVSCSSKCFGVAEISYETSFIKGTVTVTGSGDPISCLCYVTES